MKKCNGYIFDELVLCGVACTVVFHVNPIFQYLSLQWKLNAHTCALTLDLLVFGIIVLKFSLVTGLWCFLYMSRTDLEASQTHGFYLSLIVIFVNIS